MRVALARYLKRSEHTRIMDFTIIFKSEAHKLHVNSVQQCWIDRRKIVELLDYHTIF